MTILGFDTATAATAACLLRDDGRAFEIEPKPAALSAPPGHARELMPAIAEVMERAGATFADLRAIAVGVGPGSFTGLRIGVSSARALAQASGAELRPVSSLAALGAGIAAPLRLPLIDAKRGELFAAVFADGEELLAPLAAPPEEIAARATGMAERPGGMAEHAGGMAEHAGGMAEHAGGMAERARGTAERAGGMAERAGGMAERASRAGIPLRAAGDGSVRFRSVLEAAGIEVEPDGSRAHVVRALYVCRLGAGAPARPPEAVLPEYLRSPDAKPSA